MGAHAVRTAVSRSIVPVAELLGRDVVDLRKRRRRRKRERDFIHQRDYMISGRSDCEHTNRNDKRLRPIDRIPIFNRFNDNERDCVRRGMEKKEAIL